MSEVQNVIIIGSGPGGLTAAIYSARANLAPLMIEGEVTSTGDQPGGQLMLTTEVENFPGFPQGILGPELMANMREQAERFGTRFITEKVTKVELESNPKVVWVGEDKYLAHSVIIATGAKALMLGIENENALLGHGLSTCATCDGFFFKGLEIAVVGGGDSALEEANFLTKFASKVTLIHRRDQLRGSKIMQDRALNNPKIEVAYNSQVTELCGDGKLEGAILTDTVTGATRRIDIAGMFIAVGHRPNTALFESQVELDKEGYIVTKGTSSYTNLNGVFACGDVKDRTYRQAITAAGSGCAAGIDAERWLEEQNLH